MQYHLLHERCLFNWKVLLNHMLHGISLVSWKILINQYYSTGNRTSWQAYYLTRYHKTYGTNMASSDYQYGFSSSGLRCLESWRWLPTFQRIVQIAFILSAETKTEVICVVLAVTIVPSEPTKHHRVATNRVKIHIFIAEKSWNPTYTMKMFVRWNAWYEEKNIGMSYLQTTEPPSSVKVWQGGEGRF